MQSLLKTPRRKARQRHNLTLCLALFTLAIAGGNKGFLAIGDWISSYNEHFHDKKHNFIFSNVSTYKLSTTETSRKYTNTSKSSASG
ncbi:MAG: transposase family protein [Methylacidiphilales bacterium]|nr:transposase family protein [Candidatus Methylacidiphilales bacterium]NJR18174.1 transposase family protein [Calothrix sp. CSU_2_0]